MYDCLSTYLELWPALMHIESHREKIPSDVYNLMTNVALKRPAEDYSKILKPVCVALNKMQASKTNLSDAVAFWNELREALDG